MNTCCPEDSTEPMIQSEEVIDQQALEHEFLVNKETRSEDRLTICRSCPSLKKPLNICNECSCFMNIKTRIYSAACPLGKW